MSPQERATPPRTSGEDAAVRLRYKTRPVEVEAFIYDGPPCVAVRGPDVAREAPEFAAVRRFVGSVFTTTQVGSQTHGGPNEYAPATRSRGGHISRIRPGNVVVHDLRAGQFYPMDRGQFDARYEPCDPSHSGRKP